MNLIFYKYYETIVDSFYIYLFIVVALYNKSNLDMRECHVHEAPVNCISFCSWDPFKLFSTSHDGSVRCGDIVKRTFDVVSNKLFINYLPIMISILII